MHYLHTMIRVGNLEKSIQFYRALGFEVKSRADYAEGKFSLVFLQQPGGNKSDPMLELTYNWGVEKYEVGSGYGHVAYRVESMAAIADQLHQNGYQFSWGPGQTPDGGRAMAFVTDPDGYKIELLEG
jgi:lactoylglutathione lyase